MLTVQHAVPGLIQLPACWFQCAGLALVCILSALLSLSCFSSAPAHRLPFNAGDLGRFVPLAWLDGWTNGGVEAAPDPVDNSQLLCPHGKLDPAKVQGVWGLWPCIFS